MLLFFSEKNQTVGYIYNASSLYSQTGENTKRAETFVWCLLFKVVYQDHATQLLPFAWDFVVKRQRLVWGQVGEGLKLCIEISVFLTILTDLKQ